MERIKGSLTAKLGPLPAWAWGILLGVAIIAARVVLSRRSEDAGAPASEPGTAAAEGAAGGSGGGAAGVPAAAPNPGAWNPAPDAPVSGVTGETAPATNEEWLRQATTAVVKSTGVTQSVVTDALSKVLAGQAVTPVEENYYSRAVAALGYPPAGAPAIIRASTVGTGGTVDTPQGPVAGTPGTNLAFFRLRITQGPGNTPIYSADSITKAAAEDVIKSMVTDNNNAPGVQAQNSYYGEANNPFWRRYTLTPA